MAHPCPTSPSEAVLPWYECWCMTPYGQEEYIKTVNRLKKEYAGKMEIALGIELDVNSEYSEKQLENFDYIISSNHSLVANDGKRYYADNSPEEMVKGVEAMDGPGRYREAHYLALCPSQLRHEHS